MRDLCVARNSHNFQIVGIHAERTLTEGFTNRILVRPESACRRFRNDCHVRAGSILSIRKITTAHDWNTEQREIARRNVVEFNRTATFLTGNGEKVAVMPVAEWR